MNKYKFSGGGYPSDEYQLNSNNIIIPKNTTIFVFTLLFNTHTIVVGFENNKHYWRKKTTQDIDISNEAMYVYTSNILYYYIEFRIPFQNKYPSIIVYKSQVIFK